MHISHDVLHCMCGIKNTPKFPAKTCRRVIPF